MFRTVACAKRVPCCVLCSSDKSEPTSAEAEQTADLESRTQILTATTTASLSLLLALLEAPPGRDSSLVVNLKGRARPWLAY